MLSMRSGAVALRPRGSRCRSSNTRSPMRAVRPRRRRADRGAAAVEFALGTPVLLVMLFGIIDYGIWFAGSISARQAVRDAARQGSVGQFGSCTSVVPNPLANL